MFKYFPVTITVDNRKVPLIRDWQTQGSSDPAQIKLWQEQFRDRLTCWGIATGPQSGVLALDIDVKDPTKNGFDSLMSRQLVVNPTLCQKTRTGGMHYVYNYPRDGKRYGNKTGIFPGVDVRGDGGFIAVYGLDKTPLAPAPDWLLQETIKTPPMAQGSPVLVDPSIANEKIRDAIEAILDAPEGERNHTLNRQGFLIGQLVSSGSITQEYATQVLTDAGEEIGLNPSEIKKTIGSCIKGGHAKPITCPFDPATMPAIPLPPVPDRWTPKYFTMADLNNTEYLKQPQLFKDWSTEDIHLTTADGGTGKTTLKLYEAICLALGERFLGFDCMQTGKTLFITGEDRAGKLGAMIGAITREMGISNDLTKMEIILSSIVVKKDSDLCIISKDKNGFMHLNEDGMNKVLEAVHDLKPKMIVFDPISSFWGSEAALNDMAKAVSKFMGRLVEESAACVEMINHMGKASSNNKDMSQFAGRGGTGLPSHARVSRVLRAVDEEEYLQLTGNSLEEGESAMMCNVNKFSDGSPLYNKEFLIIRKGFLFRRTGIADIKIREEKEKTTDAERVFKFIKEERNQGKYPTKSVITSKFAAHTDKISAARVKDAINVLVYEGFKNEKLKITEHPDATISDKALIITDLEGVEV